MLVLEHSPFSTDRLVGFATAVGSIGRIANTGLRSTRRTRVSCTTAAYAHCVKVPDKCQDSRGCGGSRNDSWKLVAWIARARACTSARRDYYELRVADRQPRRSRALAARKNTPRLCAESRAHNAAQRVVRERNLCLSSDHKCACS